MWAPASPTRRNTAFPEAPESLNPCLVYKLTQDLRGIVPKGCVFCLGPVEDTSLQQCCTVWIKCIPRLPRAHYKLTSHSAQNICFLPFASGCLLPIAFLTQTFRNHPLRGPHHPHRNDETPLFLGIAQALPLSFLGNIYGTDNADIEADEL